MNILNVITALGSLTLVFATIYQINKENRSKNITENRMSWLNNLQEYFIELNNILYKFERWTKETNNNQDWQKNILEFIEATDNVKIKLSLMFKIKKMDEKKELNEYIATIYNNQLSDTNQVEAELINILEYLKELYIVVKDDNNKIYNVQSANNTYKYHSDQMFICVRNIIEQFELYIKKVEWDKVKHETESMFTNTSDKNPLLDTLNNNIRYIIESNIMEADEDSSKENNSTEKADVSSKEIRDIQGDNLQNSTVNNDDKLTVGKLLERTIKTLDSKYEGNLPNSITTTSGKRYIYSTQGYLHPNTRKFFNPKECESVIDGKSYYIETNFSKKYASDLIKRLEAEVKTFNS